MFCLIGSLSDYHLLFVHFFRSDLILNVWKIGGPASHSFVHHPLQMKCRKRFHEKMKFLYNAFVPCEIVIKTRTAGHIEHLEIVSHNSQSINEFESIEVRHENIHQDQIDGVFVARADRQRMMPVIGCDNSVAVLTEKTRNKASNYFVVIDYKDCSGSLKHSAFISYCACHIYHSLSHWLIPILRIAPHIM